MKKKLLLLVLALALAFVIAFSFAVCNAETVEKQNAAISRNLSAGSRAVYWYLCDNNMESSGGFATGDLSELMKVELPENVNVVIETGNTSIWQNDMADAEKLQRRVYSSEGVNLVKELPFENLEYEMCDAMGNYAYSNQVTFDYTSGEIITTVY